MNPSVGPAVGPADSRAIADRLAAAARHLSRWQFRTARDILRRLLDEPGATALQRQSARRMLAEVLRELGEVPEAYALAAPLLTECAEAYGQRHPATVRAAALLAAILHDIGELDRAEGLYRLVLAVPVPEAGPAARAVALAAANVALLQADRGDLLTAHSGLAAAYTAFRQRYGAADLDSIRIGADLAALHRRLGDLPAARRVLAVTHAAACGALGEDHPLTRAIDAELTDLEGSPVSFPRTLGETTGQVQAAPHHRRSGGRRWGRVAAVAALVAGAAMAGAGLGYPRLAQLFHRTTVEDAATSSVLPAPAQPPEGAPTGVVLRDLGGTLEVTWQPAPGATGRVLVVVSRPGRGSVARADLAPGVTEYRVVGLNAGLDYCVTVSVTGGPRGPAAAAPVCTHRTA